MAYLSCPLCQGGLEVDVSVEVGSTDLFDEVTVQYVYCAQCGTEAPAVYEESRRGSLQDESVHHWMVKPSWKSRWYKHVLMKYERRQEMDASFDVGQLRRFYQKLKKKPLYEIQLKRAH